MSRERESAVPIKVLLADDHVVLRKGLRLLLEEEEDITVVAEAGDGREAVDLVRSRSPDVVVMDITMPNLSGIDATRSIVSEFPGVRVVALSIHKGKQFVEDMLRAGAAGYILKESAPKELLTAVRDVMRGEIAMSHAITGVVVEQYMSALRDGPDPDAEKRGESALSPAEPPPAVHKTKLFPPEVPKGHVCRTRLTERLTEHAGQPLILVSAPAGYGKSTLVSCWLRESELPMAWLSLDENENDLRSFLQHFVAAVETVRRDALPEIRSLLAAAGFPPADTLAGILANELEKLEGSVTLVMDDFHLIEKRPVLDLIAGLLRHPPRSLRLVLISRRDPMLPLASLRAGNLLHEIRLQDLCFDQDETALYLKTRLGTPVELSVAAEWVEKTEGWITGLQLAALSISHRGERGSLLPELHGGAQYVMEYLFNEVLSSQPPPTRRTLVGTSILDRFCGPLCETVCGPEDQGSSGWDFVRFLKSENLFVISLDAEGRWFRYHHLFQQLLRNQAERHFSRDEIAALHSRAGGWFAENGFIEEALDHFIAAGDETGAAELFERHRFVPLDNDQVYVLERWLSKFSDETIRRRPALLMARAWMHDYHFQLPAVPALLDSAESLLKGSRADKILSGEIDFFRGYFHTLMNESDSGLKRLESAAENVPLAHAGLRGHIELLYGLALQMEGRKEEADGRLTHLLSRDRGRRGVLRSRLLITLVYIHIISGELEQALEENLQLQEFTAQGGYDYARLWSVYLQGVIHFHRNELEAARTHLSLAVEKRYILHVRAAFDSIAGLLLVSSAMGREDDVQSTLERLHEYVGNQSDPSFALFARSCRARLAIMQGRPEEAYGWIRGAPPPPENMLWWLDAPSVTYCRALLAEGSDDSLESAEVRLRELLQLSRDSHNVIQEVTIAALLAVVCQKRENTDEAQNFLNLALDRGMPGGLLRPFVEAGPPIIPLLKTAAREGSNREFAGTVLSGLGDTAGAAAKSLRAVPVTASGSQPLVDPLTRREIELLAQLAQRYSNSEIAEHLFISTTTVKAHLRSIFQKLDVGNRREAVARAVKLGILQ